MDTRVTFEEDDQPVETPSSRRPGDQGLADSLSRAQFDANMKGARRSLWCIAAAILGRPDRAEDVIQDAAVTALTKLDQFDPGTNFTAWMGQIVRYSALNARRKDQDKPIAHGADPDLAESPTQHDQHAVDSAGKLAVDQQSFDDDVLAALSTLDEIPRACLLLRTVRGLSYKEIARALDLPEGTAMSHVHRARTSLRKSLTPAQQENRP